jgi:heptosyltransferase-2
MKFLIIQTAFIGDVVLATPLIEKIKLHYPNAVIDFLVRKGNEGLLLNHPHLRNVIVFDKQKRKYRNLFNIIREIRKRKYDFVINAQRFFATGLITVMSGAKETIGFDKNPLSRYFTRRVGHQISSQGKGDHEVRRNLSLIDHLAGEFPVHPKLYPAEADYEKIKGTRPYICIAPASVWFTKQLPKERWINFINEVPPTYTIYLMGAKSDIALCDEIQSRFTGDASRMINLAGQLTFLESAALMKNAAMNYVNDSAPLHFASAMNAPVTAVFCSTVPAFGFGPLSDESYIVENKTELKCRPCGLHGKKACPLGHFHCSEIESEQLLATLIKNERKSIA